MRQRSEFLAGNPLNHQTVAITLAPKARHRHPAVRERDLYRICKSQWCIARDFSMLLVCHHTNSNGVKNERVNLYR